MPPWLVRLLAELRRRFPPQPAAPPVFPITIHFRDAITLGMLNGRVVIDGQTPHDQGVLGAIRWDTFTAPGFTINGYVEGYDPVAYPIHEIPSPEDVYLDFLPLPKPVPPTDTRGTAEGTLTSAGHLTTAGGRAWVGTGVTAFPMGMYWKTDPAKVRHAFDWMIDHDAEIARVLVMAHRGICEGVMNFGPGDLGGEDACIQHYVTLVDYAASRRVRLDIQCFADMQLDGCKPDNPLSNIDQPRFFSRLGEALGGKWNVILGGGNQYAKNGFDPARLARPVNLYASRGSGLEDQLPFLPPWGLSEFHPGRSEFTRKFKSAREMREGDTGPANNNQAVPGPIWFTEPIGIGSVPEPGKTCADPFAMWGFAAGCKAFGVAALYGHLRPMIQTLDTPAEGSLAELTFDAMVDGYRTVPNGYALASLARGQSPTEPHNDTLGMAHDDAWALRTYELRAGPTSLLLVVDPTPANPFRLQAGAKITEAFGYRKGGKPDTVFVLARP